MSYIILSINIQPTSGGVAPLYNALGPSRLTVFKKQSKGPLNLPSDLLVVCIRILIVSRILYKFTVMLCTQNHSLPKGWPTTNLVIPEAIPAANPRTRLWMD
jgi:hypothetical protein